MAKNSLLIYADTVENEQKAAQGSAECMDASIKEIKVYLDYLQGNWSGTDYTNFVEKMNTFITESQKFNNTILGMCSVTKTYVEALRAIDAAYGEKEITLK